MTFDQFISKYLGKKADWDGAYGGQCVDLFRFYVNDVLGLPQPKGVVGASDFWTNYDTDPILKDNFTKIPNTPEFVPEKGDVVIWNKRAGGGYGHIAIFIEGDINKFISLDQNWPTLSLVTKTEHNYTNVLGVLRYNKIQQNMSEDIRLKLLDEAGLRTEGDVRACIDSHKNFPKLQADKDNLQIKYDELLKIHETVKEDFAIELKEAESKNKAYKEFIAEVAKKIGTNQETEPILARLATLVEKEDKLASIIDNRPVKGENWIQSLIKALKAVFDKADKAVNN